MNFTLVALELRKNRLTLIGLGLAFAVVLPLSLLVAPSAGLGATQAVETGLILWTLAGLPLSAAFVGATAGAGLRDAAVRDAEAPFPGSPAGRLLRAFAAVMLQFLLLTLGTALFSAAVSPGWRGAVLGLGQAPMVWAELAPMRDLIAFLCLDFLACSFLAAYVLGHALAGGMLGVALALGEAAALGLGFQYSMLFSDRVESFVPLAALAALAGLAARAFAAKPLASRFEHAKRLGAGGAAGTAALLAVGLIAAWGAEENAYARLRSSLRLVKPGEVSPLVTIGPSVDEAEAALYPKVREAGLLASTFAGGLFWIAPDGHLVRLLPDVDAGRFSSFALPGVRFEAAVWDESGRLLISRGIMENGKVEFWAGRPERGLHPVDPALGAPEQILREDGMAGIRFRKDGKEIFCALDDDARARSCVPSKRTWSLSYPLAARLSRDGLSLARPGPAARTWRLPGRALDMGPVSEPVRPYLLAGKPAYFVPVRIKDDEMIAVCSNDGRVRTIWKHDWYGLRTIGGLRLDVLPDGTLVYQYTYDWNVADPVGALPPPIPSKQLFARWPRPSGATAFTPQLVHRAAGHDWIIFEGTRLVEMDESTGIPLRDWPLTVNAGIARVSGDLHVLEDGLLLQRFDLGAPLFVGWDGSTRRLSAP